MQPQTPGLSRQGFIICVPERAQNSHPAPLAHAQPKAHHGCALTELGGSALASLALAGSCCGARGIGRPGLDRDSMLISCLQM